MNEPCSALGNAYLHLAVIINKATLTEAAIHGTLVTWTVVYTLLCALLWQIKQTLTIATQPKYPLAAPNRPAVNLGDKRPSDPHWFGSNHIKKSTDVRFSGVSDSRGAQIMRLAGDRPNSHWTAQGFDVRPLAGNAIAANIIKRYRFRLASLCDLICTVLWVMSEYKICSSDMFSIASECGAYLVI